MKGGDELGKLDLPTLFKIFCKIENSVHCHDQLIPSKGNTCQGRGEEGYDK